MIVGLLHPGSGLGDQLFCYLAARITAERLGVPFGMVGVFKGESFMKIDSGREVIVSRHYEQPAGKIIIDNDFPVYEGKTYYDPEFNFIGDNTIVDGCRCQDERYWKSNPIQDWLKVKPLGMPDDLCIIGFRGGEYATVPDLFLTEDYWQKAIQMMRGINPCMRFRVVTDDPVLAEELFPDTEITHEISMDWRQVRYAKYAIIANSAFYILPRWLRHNSLSDNWSEPVTIAPYGWARRNFGKGYWEMPANYYPRFQYV